VFALSARSGDAVSPIAKAKKIMELPLNCSKKHPLPVNSSKYLVSMEFLFLRVLLQAANLKYPA
jgi:hypothetical protein